MEDVKPSVESIKPILKTTKMPKPGMLTKSKKGDLFGGASDSNKSDIKSHPMVRF